MLGMKSQSCMWTAFYICSGYLYLYHIYLYIYIYVSVSIQAVSEIISKGISFSLLLYLENIEK